MKKNMLTVFSAIWLGFAIITGLVFQEFEWSRMGFILSGIYTVGQYLSFKIDEK